jgi:hypothetical protein
MKFASTVCRLRRARHVLQARVMPPSERSTVLALQSSEISVSLTIALPDVPRRDAPCGKAEKTRAPNILCRVAGDREGVVSAANSWKWGTRSKNLARACLQSC